MNDKISSSPGLDSFVDDEGGFKSVLTLVNTSCKVNNLLLYENGAG